MQVSLLEKLVYLKEFINICSLTVLGYSDNSVKRHIAGYEIV